MTATPVRLVSYPTTRRTKTEKIPPRNHRPVVSVALNTAVVVPDPVGFSDPPYCDRRSSSSLCFSMSGGYTYGTREEVGRLTEQMGGTCQDDRVISFPLTSLPVPERDRRDAPPGIVPMLVCVAEGAADGFGILRAVLGAFSTVYGKHQVRPPSLAQN